MTVAEQEKLDTYEKWKEYATKIGTNPTYWQYAGDWFFPTPQNKWEISRGKFYHICPANWRLNRSSDKSESAQPCTERCGGCGTEIPEGIKMIALLLSW